MGALTTHNDVLGSAAFRREALPLVQACAEIGAPQIRTRGTVAGNWSPPRRPTTRSRPLRARRRVEIAGTTAAGT